MRSPESNSLSPELSPVALFAVWLVLALGIDTSGRILETIEVGPPPGTAASIADDRYGETRTARFSGVLPSDFPAAFPVEPTWSLLDFGAARGDRRYVALRVPGDLATARAHIAGTLAAAGWWPVAGEPSRWRSGEHTVAIGFRTVRGATQLRVEY
jgi:hypothetical protein